MLLQSYMGWREVALTPSNMSWEEAVLTSQLQYELKGRLFSRSQIWTEVRLLLHSLIWAEERLFLYVSIWAGGSCSHTLIYELKETVLKLSHLSWRKAVFFTFQGFLWNGISNKTPSKYDHISSFEDFQLHYIQVSPRHKYRTVSFNISRKIRTFAYCGYL